jgi:hypothetical protein
MKLTTAATLSFLLMEQSFAKTMRLRTQNKYASRQLQSGGPENAGQENLGPADVVDPIELPIEDISLSLPILITGVPDVTDAQTFPATMPAATMPAVGTTPAADGTTPGPIGPVVESDLSLPMEMSVPDLPGDIPAIATIPAVTDAPFIPTTAAPLATLPAEFGLPEMSMSMPATISSPATSQAATTPTVITTPAAVITTGATGPSLFAPLGTEPAVEEPTFIGTEPTEAFDLGMSVPANDMSAPSISATVPPVDLPDWIDEEDSMSMEENPFDEGYVFSEFPVVIFMYFVLFKQKH